MTSKYASNEHGNLYVAHTRIGRYLGEHERIVVAATLAEARAQFGGRGGLEGTRITIRRATPADVDRLGFDLTMAVQR